MWLGQYVTNAKRKLQKRLVAHSISKTPLANTSQWRYSIGGRNLKNHYNREYSDAGEFCMIVNMIAKLDGLWMEMLGRSRLVSAPTWWPWLPISTQINLLYTKTLNRITFPIVFLFSRTSRCICGACLTLDIAHTRCRPQVKAHLQLPLYERVIFIR